jgi:DNA mismatch endonuclease (patch repair protein)
VLDQPLIDAFGKRIRRLRTDRGLSQEQLAELTGFHRTYIGMIERSAYNTNVDRLTKERRSWLMSRVRSKDTTTEIAVRRLVFGMGYRFRLHYKHLAGRPDLVFPSRRKVIFVNGCFWHGHEKCRYGRLPKTRVEFWKTKIENNRKRDRNSLINLASSGWSALTVWQCELKDPDALTDKLYEFLEHE